MIYALRAGSVAAARAPAPALTPQYDGETARGGRGREEGTPTDWTRIGLEVVRILRPVGFGAAQKKGT